MLTPSPQPESPRPISSGAKLRTLALAVSLAIHGAVIGILEQMDTQGEEVSTVEEDPEETTEVLKSMREEEVKKILEKLTRSEEGAVLDYLRLDAIQSKIVYYTSHPKYLSEREIHEKIDTEVTALNEIFEGRVNKLAEDPSLSWTGDVRADFPTLQKALYLDKKRLFLNSSPLTWYQRDAWNFTEEFMDGLVNCQSARANSLVLRLIYERKGLPTTDLERLKTLSWKDHVASVYVRDDGYTQLQNLSLDHPEQEGLSSQITGEEGVVVDLRAHMAIYLLEQKDIDLSAKWRALNFSGKTSAKFSDKELPFYAFPLDQNPVFYGGTQEVAQTSTQEQEASLERSMAGARKDMRRDVLVQIKETYAKSRARNTQVLEEPEWVKLEAFQEIMLHLIEEDVEKLLGNEFSLNDAECTEALYLVLHLQFYGPNNRLGEILDEKVKSAKNPSLGLLRTRSSEYQEPSALDLALWDRISQREDFKQNWETILENGTSESGDYYGLNLRYYKYISQYLNTTKNFHFNLQEIETHLDPRKNRSELLTSFDINQMTEKEKLDVMITGGWSLSHYAAGKLKKHELVYKYIEDRINQEDIRNGWSGPVPFLAGLSQSEVDRNPSSKDRYIKLWLSVVEADNGRFYYDSDVPFLREVREKSRARIKIKKLNQAKEHARLEEAHYPKIVRDLYCTTDSIEYSKSDLEALDAYFKGLETAKNLREFLDQRLNGPLSKELEEGNKKALKDLYESLGLADRRRLLELSGYFPVDWFDATDLYEEDLKWINETKITETTPAERINLKLKYSPQNLSLEECSYAIALTWNVYTRNKGTDGSRAEEININKALTDPEWLKQILDTH